MEAFSEAISRTIKYEVKASTHGLTEDHMKDSGKETSSTAKENTSLQITLFTMESGEMA